MSKAPVQFYSMDQVAERLHKSRRWLQDYLKEHPHYRLAGRTKLFTEEHIAALYEALPCPSSSSRPVKASPRSIAFGEPTSVATWTELQKLLTAPSRQKSYSNGESRSNAGSLRKRASQPSQMPR